MKPLLLLLLILGLVSCTGDHVGKYVYVDGMKCIHVEKDCFKKNAPKEGLSKELQIVLARGVDFVDTCELVSYYDYYKESLFSDTYKYRKYDFCPTCVTDRDYEHLQCIMQRNEQRQEQQASSHNQGTVIDW